MGLIRILPTWRALVTTLALCLGSFGGAQGLAFLHFDGRNGLPQSQVEAILEDSKGFIWIGTDAGVARLGAGGVRAFEMAQGLGAGRVRALLEDGDGAIWVAMTGASLARIYGSDVESFDEGRGLPDKSNYALALDPKGRVLVGTSKGLYRLEGQRFQKVVLGAWDNLPILSMVRQGPEGLWLGSRGGRLAHWEADHLREEHLPTGPQPADIWRLLLEPSGRLCALTRPGLYQRAAQGAWEPMPLLGYQGVPKLLDANVSSDGTLIIGLGDDGLYLQKPDGTVQRLTSRDGLPEEVILCGYKDRNGVLWVGTDGKGVYAQAIPGLNTLSTQGSTELGDVLDMEEMPGQGMFLSTSRGVFLWDEARGLKAHWGIKEGLPSNEVWALCGDGQGGLWIGTAKGLVRWRNGRILPGKWLGEARIYQVLPWRGAFLVGTEQGLFLLDRIGRKLGHFEIPAEAGVRDALVLLREGAGILVGSAKGLWRFDGSGLKRIFAQAPFAGIEVGSLYSGQPGDLWAGTVQGLWHLVQGRWEAVGPEHGLPDPHIYFVGDGGRGQVAVGHGHGVTFFDPNGGALTLNQSLGLLANETNSGAIHLDRRGRLWMGMVGGVCLLDRNRELRLPSLGPPVVLEASWPGGRQPWPRQLVLPPHVEFVEFDFEAGLPISGRAPRYETLIEGLTTRWEETSGGPGIRYPRLPPGHYRLRMRASLDGKQWLESEPVRFRIRPTWYEHPLGKGILILLGLGLIGSILQWRTRRLRLNARVLEARVEDRTRSLDQRNRELEEAHSKVKEAHDRVQETLDAKIAFIRMVVHDLRSPLTTMSLLAGRMTEKAADRGITPPKELDLLEREAQRIDELLRHLLDQAREEATSQFMNFAQVSPQEALAGLEAVFQLKAADAGLTFHFVEEATGVQVLGDPLALQQVALNLFGNALKYTPAPGAIRVHSFISHGSWALEVCDTGRGLEPDHLNGLFKPFSQVEISDIGKGWGLGLSIVKTIVDAHHGQVEVESSPGHGTTFRVLIPLSTEGSSG